MSIRALDNDGVAQQLVPPGAEKQDRIIERAIIMFNEVGYDRVRVSDITDSLRMGKGTFYLYFRNKKELLLSCFDHVGELIRELESLPGIREGDFFSKVGPRVESIGRTDWFPGLVNLIRGSELSPDAEIKQKAREAYETIAHFLRRDLQTAIRAGRAREVDIDLAVYGFIGMADNLWFRSRLDNSYSAEGIVEFAVDATTRLLSSEPPPPEEQAQMALDEAVRLICRDGTEFDLENVRYNGESHLSGVVGQAQIDVNPAAVSGLVIREAGDEYVAGLTMADMTEIRVLVDGSMVVSGDATIGTLRIAIRDVSTLAPRHSLEPLA